MADTLRVLILVQLIFRNKKPWNFAEARGVLPGMRLLFWAVANFGTLYIRMLPEGYFQ